MHLQWAAAHRTGAKPQVVFTAGEFNDLVMRFELEHIRIRTYHPESNGSWSGITARRAGRGARPDEDLRNLSKARELIGRC
jgi:hypothetical protein